MIIRGVDPARDAAACAALYAPHVADSPVSFEEEPPDAAAMRERIERLTATHPWLVAELDGEIVGYAYAAPHRERAAYRWAVNVSIFVTPGLQRRGVGRALYVELIERLRRQGFQVALAGITLPNEASVALHESVAFVRVSLYPRIGWKAGAWRDVGWWQLELAPPGDEPPAEPTPDYPRTFA